MDTQVTSTKTAIVTTHGINNIKFNTTGDPNTIGSEILKHADPIDNLPTAFNCSLLALIKQATIKDTNCIQMKPVKN